MNLIFLARQDTPVDSKAHQYLATAESELEGVSHIARQTLGYYRDSGPPSTEHLHDLLENVLTVYRGKLLSSGIRVETTFNDLQKIVVSKGEMIQVFSDILVNAIDAMAHGGTLRISTRKTAAPSGDGILTTIRDEGSGIRMAFRKDF